MLIQQRKTTMNRKPDSASWIQNKILLGMTFPEYIKSNFTVPNAIAAIILIVSIPVMIYRFHIRTRSVNKPFRYESMGNLDRY